MKLTARFERSGNSAGGSEDRAVQPESGRSQPAPSAAARNLALAHHIERLIEKGFIADYTQAAQMLGVSQPRMTHLMGLLLLSPFIQEAILLGAIAAGDKELRALSRVAEWAAQASLSRTVPP